MANETVTIQRKFDTREVTIKEALVFLLEHLPEDEPTPYIYLDRNFSNTYDTSWSATVSWEEKKEVMEL
jgi:hypothetical protein